MIELRNVEKSYPAGAGRYYVLRRIEMQVREGDFITIMGPSGAGKSTLLSVIGMLDGDWNGAYDFPGHPVPRLNVKQRAELNKKYIGFVFEQYHRLDGLTVAENLEIPLSDCNIEAAEGQAKDASWRGPDSTLQ
jgi:putative ABC transport system ATP-binding protein